MVWWGALECGCLQGKRKGLEGCNSRGLVGGGAKKMLGEFAGEVRGQGGCEGEARARFSMPWQRVLRRKRAMIAAGKAWEWEEEHNWQ